MNTYNVIVLGASGSGKTVFLASMYKQLSIQRRDSPFFLDVDPEHQRILTQKYREIADPGGWPAATKRNEVSEWCFTCRVQSPDDLRIYTALQFTYLDYAGESLTEPQMGASQSDFDAKVKDADALLGILDGRKILALMQDESDGYDFIYSDLAIILQDMQRSQNPVHFVITKWDLLQNRNYTLRDVRMRLQQTPDFQEFVESRVKKFTVRLIPVSSVGMRFAELQPNGSMRKIPGAYPQPFQIEMPLVCVLPDNFKAQIDSLKARQVQIQPHSSTLDRPLADLLGLVAGSVVRFARGFLLGSYQFTDTVIDRLLNFVELSAGKRREEAERLRLQRENTLKAVRDEQTAVEHAITSYLVLVRQLERDFPESVFSRTG